MIAPEEWDDVPHHVQGGDGVLGMWQACNLKRCPECCAVVPLLYTATHAAWHFEQDASR